jgi:hypothetical protein
MQLLLEALRRARILFGRCFSPLKVGVRTSVRPRGAPCPARGVGQSCGNVAGVSGFQSYALTGTSVLAVLNWDLFTPEGEGGDEAMTPPPGNYTKISPPNT